MRPTDRTVTAVGDRHPCTDREGGEHDALRAGRDALPVERREREHGADAGQCDPCRPDVLVDDRVPAESRVGRLGRDARQR